MAQRPKLQEGKWLAQGNGPHKWESRDSGSISTVFALFWLMLMQRPGALCQGSLKSFCSISCSIGWIQNPQLEGCPTPGNKHWGLMPNYLSLFTQIVKLGVSKLCTSNFKVFCLNTKYRWVFLLDDLQSDGYDKGLMHILLHFCCLGIPSSASLSGRLLSIYHQCSVISLAGLIVFLSVFSLRFLMPVILIS